MGWCPQCVGPVPLESAAGAAHTGRCWSDPEGGVMSAPVSEGEAIRRGSEVRLPRLTVSGLEVLLELRRRRTQGRAGALNHQQIAHAALTLKPQRDHPRIARAPRMARYHGDAKPCRHRLEIGRA